MTGFQCLEQIRREERLRDLKVIVLSTASTPDIVELAYEKGADLYIPKGFDFERFKRLLGRCFK
jgi:CheY-like chemotaxis protein